MTIRTLNTALVIALALAAGAEAGPPTPPAQAAGYSLVFFDDFLNLNMSPDGTGEYVWYKGFPWEHSPASPFNASVTSSILDLAWKTGQSLPDTTISSCSSDGTHCNSFRYGYFEASMKWDVTPGAWPAFLLLPVQGLWGNLDNGEIDVFEGQAMGYNNQWFFGTIHEQVTAANGSGTTDIQNNGCCNHVLIPNVNFSQSHTYGLLWVPGKITWYFDNQPVLTASSYSVFDTQNYFLVFSSQLGANWVPGSTSGVTASQLNLNIDWVKVWQQH